MGSTKYYFIRHLATFVELLIPFLMFCFIREFFTQQIEQPSLLIIQCGNVNDQNDLVACAQHICKEAKAEYWNELHPVHVLFLLQLSHIHGEGFKALSGSQTSWKYMHIDELREPSEKLPSLIRYLGKPISSLFVLKSNSGECHTQPVEKQLNDMEDDSFMDSELMRVEKVHCQIENDSESEKVIDVVQEMFPIIKGCIQAAMRELSDIKKMTTDDVGMKIKILFDLLQNNQGKS